MAAGDSLLAVTHISYLVTRTSHLVSRTMIVKCKDKHLVADDRFPNQAMNSIILW